MMPGDPREFTYGAVLSAVTGYQLCPLSDVRAVADHVAGREVTPDDASAPEFRARLRAAIGAQSMVLLLASDLEAKVHRWGDSVLSQASAVFGARTLTLGFATLQEAAHV